MCLWFSCNSDGKGKIYYFNAEQRQQIREGKLFDGTKGNNKITNADSHSSISTYFGLNDDLVNKYEFRPLDRKFIIDQRNVEDDSEIVRKKVQKLDFKRLAPPELIFKPIVNPFKDRKAKRVSKKDIELLKKWSSIRVSVGVSVRDSVEDSVRGSIWASIGRSIWASIGSSIWDSVKDSIGDSIGDSVRDSIGDSIGDSIRAYISSFFNLKKWNYIERKEGENPFQPSIDLWERGIVPAFVGEEWLLFGYKGKLLKRVRI